MRTEAQKRADAKYNKEKRGQFFVTLTLSELGDIKKVIASAGMTKGQFLRWAVEQLKEAQK